MNTRKPRGSRPALLLLPALVLTIAVALPSCLGGGPASLTIKVDSADRNRKPDNPLTLGPKALEAKEDAGAPSSDVAEPMRGVDHAKAGVVTGPLASQEWPGCKTAFVRNFSSRRGNGVRAIALHYTAGGNISGWADINGLTAYSNSAANQVSWHFSVDREGNCAYNVPITEKAWTISGLNSQTVNIEVVGTGHEGDYAGAAGLRKVGLVVRRIARIEGIPLQLGATDGNCNVTRPGIITHWMGGPCSGGHHDIKPYALGPVIAYIRALGTEKRAEAIYGVSRVLYHGYWLTSVEPRAAAR